MRRLCLILLCCLVIAPVALASTLAPGDGVLELSKVNGAVAVTASRGTLWGQMDKGKLVVTDPAVGDGQILVSGWDTKRPGLLDGTTVYSGTNVRFRVSGGGNYRLSLRGSGIDLTAVGVGSSQLSGDLLAVEPGNYALDSGKWIPVPYFPASRLVRFGAQPATVGGP